MSQIERVNGAWDHIEKCYAEKVPDYELGVGYWASAELLSSERIKDEWNVRARLIDDGTLDDWNGWVEDKDCIQTCWFSKLWISIDSDGCGSSTCLDLNPGPQGKIGQIIFLDHDLGTKGPIFQDFAGYLENVANKLEGGKYQVTNGYPEEIFVF